MLAHSAAVVGVNTTAMIEAAILGKSVLTVLNARLHPGEHAPLPLPAGGERRLPPGRAVARGARRSARGVLGEDDGGSRARRRFVESFVRPHGLDRPAAPILADAIEGLAGVRARPAARDRGSARCSARGGAGLALRAARFRPLGRRRRNGEPGKTGLWRDTRPRGDGRRTDDRRAASRAQAPVRAAWSTPPDAGAARPRLPDPALGRHAPQPAVRRPSRVPCAPERAPLGYLETSGPRVRPRQVEGWFEILYEPRRPSDWAPATGSPASGRSESTCFRFLLGGCRSGSSTRASGGVARGPRDSRLLLHVLLQCVARQPEPLPPAEEDRDGFTRGSWAGAVEPDLRRLPGRAARLDRGEPPRVVRVGAAPQGGTGTSSRRSSAGGPRPRGRSPRPSVTGNASSSSPTRSSSPGPRRR